jgi:hypothetical protein
MRRAHFPLHLPLARPSRSRPSRARTSSRAALAALAFATAGCAAGAPSLGASNAEARLNADQLFAALAERLGPITRNARLAAIRPRYVRNALTPSRIFDDTSVWSSRDGATRTIAVEGAPDGGRYVVSALAVGRPASLPDAPGRARHVMRLERLSDSQFQWDSRDELAVGGASAAQLTEALVATLASLERRSPAEIRADYERTLPRTTAALGRLFALDTLRVLPGRDGATALYVGLRIDPERLRATQPAFTGFAGYVDKYIKHIRYRVTIRDPRRGVTYLEATARDNFLTLHLRTRDGVLQPLYAPPQPLPDTLELSADVFARALIFTVGATNLIGTCVLVREPHARGVVLNFRREPDWHFPLAVEHLLRSSLRRPFAAPGTTFAYRAQTLLERDTRITVQESAIVRWLGMLGSRAMSDVTSRVEYEKDRFTADAFRALRSDLRDALATEGSAVAR